jgi:hypothetical protein
MESLGRLRPGWLRRLGWLRWRLRRRLRRLVLIKLANY